MCRQRYTTATCRNTTSHIEGGSSPKFPSGYKGFPLHRPERRPMPTLHVCPLSRLRATVTAAGASHVVSLVGPGARVERPPTVTADRHLVIGVSDIVQPLDGHVLATGEHIGQLIAFVRAWDRESPLVVHCWAGISR